MKFLSKKWCLQSWSSSVKVGKTSMRRCADKTRGRRALGMWRSPTVSRMYRWKGGCGSYGRETFEANRTHIVVCEHVGIWWTLGFNSQLHQCCEGFTHLGPKTLLQHDDIMFNSVLFHYFQGLNVLQSIFTVCYCIAKLSVNALGTVFSIFQSLDFTFKPVSRSVTEDLILYNTFLYIPSIFYCSFYKCNSTTSSSTGGF